MAKLHKALLPLGMAGIIEFFAVETVSLLVYVLSEDKTMMTFQNLVHIVVTMVVVFCSIVFKFLIAFGYKKTGSRKNLGSLCLAAAIIFTYFGLPNPIVMNVLPEYLGIAERIVIFPLQILIIILSLAETIIAFKGIMKYQKSYL